MLNSILWIMIGSLLGGASRYLIQQSLEKEDVIFPWAIFFVNLLGCFLIGAISSFLKFTNPTYQETINYVLIIGFCGSFTTFSTFSKQSLELLEKGYYTSAFSYMILSMFLGILFVFIGMKIGSLIGRG